jgi:hypothetical protein
VAVEVKTGKGATISPNQQLGYNETGSVGAVLDTNKLNDLYAIPQGTLMRAPVEFDVWDCSACS